eukprot:CAMPEP_0202717076 /NCGR_PEP_ID=MMETSP1385-20130828/107771_1 /ASSEMBLY_ACC=CAM_ASM_000861 /TAXON_ID=933848 /ORGANISM="Elphidium margaritaceum" /LENGTH=253 /DNA_ID=CAMNT_0049379125 /DNA_START=41 /DNA_END=802 /DNA_ORIENTATION=+
MSDSDPTSSSHGNNGNASRKASILPHFVPHSDDFESMCLESTFFPQKAAHRDKQPNASVSYNLLFPFSSIINGYKMAEVPSPTILQELFADELEELNKFAERKLVDHKFVHNKEYMRFHVTLKPFSWASNIPIISWIFDISVTATEDWIVDWHQHRAECLIQNESLRWSFSVDELVIIQGIYHKPPAETSSTSSAEKTSNSTFYTKLHKSLYVSTFIPIPSIMFWNYKQYSDSYIKVISKLAAFRCSSSPLEF